MPQCGYIYYQAPNILIYNFAPTAIQSPSNPNLNTIGLPTASLLPFVPAQGLTVGKNLNGTGNYNTFYSVLKDTIFYYDGSMWVSTGHYSGASTAVNLGAGGAYIYLLKIPTTTTAAVVYRYDGSADASQILTIPDFPYAGGVGDVDADSNGNFYILILDANRHVLRKYDPVGNLLKQWSINGLPYVKAHGGRTHNSV